MTFITDFLYNVDVYLDNSADWSYSEIDALFNMNSIFVQSHWGSGVVFSNMEIIRKEA